MSETAEYDPNMNLLDFVRQEMGNEALTDDECEVILWEYTAFPAGGIETIRKQLHELRDNPPEDLP